MSTDEMYFQKYMKYKAKYIDLKNSSNGANDSTKFEPIRLKVLV